MEIIIHQWSELNLHEVARLTHAAKEGGRQAADGPVPGIERRLQNLLVDLPRVAVLARSGQRLAGWAMLVVQNPTLVEVNPWWLGGHPLVAPAYDSQKVGALLLRAAVEWAGSEGFEVVELCTATVLTKGSQFRQPVDDWYASLGFRVREESVGFFCRLSSRDSPAPGVPGGTEIRPVTGVDQEELYRCYHETMSAGQSRFFFDQSETERRAYFDTFGVTYGRHEGTSLVLLRDGRIAAYSFTIPFGEHLHLDWIGVHPDVRRRGLGRFFVSLLMERAAAAGFKMMGLSCDTENSRAIALYRSLGWQPDDAVVKYAAKLQGLDSQQTAKPEGERS
jgi:GNAT superfamily N-acetyltransferase